MGLWPKYPLIYEINTWVWLSDLGAKASRPITLADVSQNDLEQIAAHGFDGVWLMGVWQRSPGARSVSRTNADWQEEFRRALPDYTVDDVVGSPYAVGDYRVDPTLGGDEGLAIMRHRLQDLGLRLVLDFVPNHMAIDHPWLQTHPHRFVQGDSELLAANPVNYFSMVVDGETSIFAHGRDPNFDGWPDTAQLDYRQPETRRAMTDLLISIAERCDGIRCDMAMLLTHDVFIRTWGGQFNPPRAEFWPAAITELKVQYPNFMLLAEVYWDMEWELLQQGFDYTYDKRLYDRLLEGDAAGVRSHLTAGIAFQGHLARFLENHDERRAAEAFGLERSKAAAVLSLTLPGVRLLHEGQLEGRRLKLPVHLGRRWPEEPIPELVDFYGRLLAILSQPIFHDGNWRLLELRPAWPGDEGYQRAVAHQWTLDDTCWVVAANLSDQLIQFHLAIDRPRLAGHNWRLWDALNQKAYLRRGEEILDPGLYIKLKPYACHLFDVQDV